MPLFAIASYLKPWAPAPTTVRHDIGRGSTPVPMLDFLPEREGGVSLFVVHSSLTSVIDR